MRGSEDTEVVVHGLPPTRVLGAGLARWPSRIDDARLVGSVVDRGDQGFCQRLAGAGSLHHAFLLGATRRRMQVSAFGFE